jgi:hypothetical protein
MANRRPVPYLWLYPVRIPVGMGSAAPQTVTRLLHELRAGNREAFSELVPLVYGEVHQIAGRHRERWDGEEILDSTALVHEAYLRLVDQTAPQWQSHPHFLAVASTAMRQILLDYAKRKHAAKPGHQHVPLHRIENRLKGAGDLSEARSTQREKGGPMGVGVVRPSHPWGRLRVSKADSGRAGPRVGDASTPVLLRRV